MTMADIQVNINPRPTVTLAPSPLVYVMAIPKIDLVTAVDYTTPLNAGEFTQITEDNRDTLGVVSANNPATETPMARAAYDFIEANANTAFYALPFDVDSNDSADARSAKCASALTAAFASATERAKLPNGEGDVIIVPRECAVGTASNAVVTALKAICGPRARAMVAVVDAGSIGHIPTARAGATEPLIADITTWSTNNGGLTIYPISNRGDVSHYNDMWGSVIMAAHWAHYTSLRGIQAHPANFRDPVLGVGNPVPTRVYDPSDGTDPATAINRESRVSSITQYNGQFFLYGGQSASAADDPRSDMGNHIVCNRMIKEGRRLLVPFRGLRGTGGNLAGIQNTLQQHLNRLYVPTAAELIEVRNPTINSGLVSVTADAKFFGFIDRVSLDIEVYV